MSNSSIRRQSTRSRWQSIGPSLMTLAAVGVLLWRAPLFGAEAPVVIPPPSIDASRAAGPLQTAVLAGGCSCRRSPATPAATVPRHSTKP